MSWPPGDEWHETAHLSLHADGRIFRRGHFDPALDDEWIPSRWLGRIDGWHRVPEEFAGELAEMLDVWADTPSRAQLEREWLQDYRANLL